MTDSRRVKAIYFLCVVHYQVSKWIVIIYVRISSSHLPHLVAIQLDVPYTSKTPPIV